MVLFVHVAESPAHWQGIDKKYAPSISIDVKTEGIFQFSIKLNHLYAWMDIFTDEMRCNFRIELYIGAHWQPNASLKHLLTVHCPQWIFDLNAKIKLSFHTMFNPLRRVSYRLGFSNIVFLYISHMPRRLSQSYQVDTFVLLDNRLFLYSMCVYTHASNVNISIQFHLLNMTLSYEKVAYVLW